MSTIDLVVEIAQEYRIIAEDMGNSVVPEASWRILWDFLSSAVPVQLELMGAGDSSTVDVLDMYVSARQFFYYPVVAKH